MRNVRGAAPRARLELTFVLVALVAHFVLTRAVGIRGLDVIPICLCVLVYAFWRGRDANVRNEWGTRRAGARACALDSLWLLGIGAAVAVAIGWFRELLVVDTHLLWTLLAYPIWGIAQQFLVLSLCAHNLDALGCPRPLLLAFAAIGFACVHFTNPPLVAATAVLGPWCAVLFFRHRNLWPLGIAHGVLGALFYRWVLGVDVVAALFTSR